MSEIRRRAAFWRNTEYSLDHMLEEVKARSGDKWFCDDDARPVSDVVKNLNDALITVRNRLIEVLSQQNSESMVSDVSGNSRGENSSTS
ncbi:MAG: hypothetical protein IJ597_08085 [Synergistaceae bacterium]|nr:hypothetical protein [Synergistaceae bacterium]